MGGRGRGHLHLILTIKFHAVQVLILYIRWLTRVPRFFPFLYLTDLPLQYSVPAVEKLAPALQSPNRSRITTAFSRGGSFSSLACNF